MPDISSGSLAICPLEKPLTYPGVALSYSGLLVGTWIYRLSPLTATSPVKWQLETDGGELRNRVLGLEEALEALDAVPMTARHPVIAIGSNSSPGQLLHKYKEDLRPVIPMTTAVVANLDIAYSAHISRAAYVPFVPRYHLGLQRRFQVLWLDSTQQEILDKTEPNYWPVRLDPSHHLTTLESGQPVSNCLVYRGRRGFLTTIEPPIQESQTHFFTWLLQQKWVPELTELAPNVDAAIEALRSSPDLRDKVSEAMLRHAGSLDDGVTQLP